MYECYPTVRLTPDEAADIDRRMLAANRVLAAAATATYGRGGHAAVRRLRNEFKAGKLSVAAAAMSEMIALEGVVVPAYINTGIKYFSAHPELYDDLTQEAAMAVYDAMYSYQNTGVKFISFVFECVRNRLNSFMRKQRNLSRQFVRGEDFAAEDRTAEEEDLGVMRLAVEAAGLRDVERELLDAHLRGDRGYCGKMVKTRNNPTTGRPYRRSLLSQIFLKACGKVRETHDRLAA